MNKITPWSLVAAEIDKEHDESLPCGDDMVRAERLRPPPASPKSDMGIYYFNSSLAFGFGGGARQGGGGRV